MVSQKKKRADPWRVCLFLGTRLVRGYHIKGGMAGPTTARPGPDAPLRCPAFDFGEVAVEVGDGKWLHPEVEQLEISGRGREKKRKWKRKWKWKSEEDKVEERGK